MPKLVHCAETIVGGIASYLRELLLLQIHTFGPGNITVVIPRSQKDDLQVPPGIQVEFFDDSGGRVIRAFCLAWKMAQVVRRIKCDVVHIHSTFAGAAVRPVLAVSRIKVRVIYCPHGWVFDRPLSVIGRVVTCSVERLLSKFTNAVVCISEHERELAVQCGISPSKLRVVVNGVNSRPPLPVGPAPAWPDGKLRLVYAGRFDYQKGVDILVSAMSVMSAEAHAVFAGGSVLKDQKELHFPPNITNVGWVSAGKLETIFESAQVVVIPSRWEGFGLVAAEAMRAGLGVIATRVGGLPEIIEDGVTGVLVEPESSQAIVDALRRLDPVSIRRMGAAGRLRVLEKFSMDRVHRELLAIYEINS